MAKSGVVVVPESELEEESEERSSSLSGPLWDLEEVAAEPRS